MWCWTILICDFKLLFETALPFTGSNIILLGPLPRYLLNKCCSDTNHITNFGEKEYLAKLGNNIRDLGKLLRNLTHTRRLKRTKVLNPAVLMGVMDSSEAEPNKLLKLFGTNPVHLTESGYKAMATRLADELYTPGSTREEPDRQLPALKQWIWRPEASPEGELDRWHPGGGTQKWKLDGKRRG